MSFQNQRAVTASPVGDGPRVMPIGNGQPEGAPMHTRHHPFLTGPIAPTLIKQALPVLIVLAAQTFVSVAETYFVGRLGTESLAGMALVFPVLMVMTMVSNGGMGGGVSSAVARALGAKSKSDANALVGHSLVIGVICGLLCMLAAWSLGPALYTKMGGHGVALNNALRYSNLAFAAAVPIWIVNLLSSALRGAGDVRTPALVVLGGALLTLGLSPLLIFGAGPVPGLGIAGAGLAMIIYNCGAAVVLIAYMNSSRSPLRLARVKLEGRLFKLILGVGIPASIGALQSNLIMVIFTGMIGHFGALALASYGIASRLDYVLIPLLFAIGTASVAMVGMNIGAGQRRRARDVALTAAGVSAALVAVIGVVAVIWPHAWMGMFSSNAEVSSVGSAYLVRVAPFYLFTGIGMALVFASQGARVMVGPLLIGTFMLIVGTVSSWYCVAVSNGNIESLFWTIGGNRALFGLLMLALLFRAAGCKVANENTVPVSLTK